MQNVIFTQIGVLALAMAIGFAAVKSGYIPEEAKDALSKVIVKITLPLVVLMSLTKVELNAALAVNCLLVAVLAASAVAVMYLVGMFGARRLGLEGSRAVIYRCMGAFGNVVFLGYPLIEALFGAEGLLYAAIYGVANDAFVWTLGVWGLAGGGGSAKKLINPVTISFVVSIILMCTGVHIGGVLGTVLDGMGSTTTWLSMLFIGGTLASVDIKGIWKHYQLLIMAVMKMVVFPLVLMLVLKWLPLAEIVKSVLILQAAMPSQTVLTIIATEYGADVKYAAEGVFVTTVLSVLTLPLMVMAMGALGI